MSFPNNVHDTVRASLIEAILYVSHPLEVGGAHWAVLRGVPEENIEQGQGNQCRTPGVKFEDKQEEMGK